MILQNINTANTHIQDSLRESEEKFRTIAETTPDAVILSDCNGTIIFWNAGAERIFGYTGREIVGCSYHMLFPDDYREENKYTLKKMLSKYSEESMPVAPEKVIETHPHTLLGTMVEIRSVRKDGSVFPAEFSNALWKKNGALFFCSIIRDITERKNIEEELRKHKEHLEELVTSRTAELAKINKQLLLEIEDRKLAQQKLLEREQELQIKSSNLEELNTALRVLLKKRDDDKDLIEEKILLNVRELVIPYLEKVKKTNLDPRLMDYVIILESNLQHIVSPFVHTLSTKLSGLTSTEIKIANFIKQGKTSKEIAGLMCLSKRTVDTHRENIRHKLGLKRTKTCLTTHLKSIK